MRDGMPVVARAILCFQPQTHSAAAATARPGRLPGRPYSSEASLLGWVHAETMSRKRLENKILRLEEEVEILKGQLKDAELELIAAAAK